MSLKDDLESEVKEIYEQKWTRRDGQKVPEDTDLKLGNDGVDMDATILYADLDRSTQLVDDFKDWFAAENYKTFLRVASKIIRSRNGVIRSFDGDRVMGIFIGESKNSAAAKCGLQIHWAVKNIIQPAMEKQYPKVNFKMKHVVGIDSSKVLITRAGIRGSNDLVWIGKAPNYAAKLSAMSPSYPTWITKSVYDRLSDETKYSGEKNMWEPRNWTAMDNMKIYRSSFTWSL